MNLIKKSTTKLYNFNLLSKYDNVAHFVSGREGGVSSDNFGSLNLSFKVGDSIDNVVNNRKTIAESLGVSYDKLVFPDQTHSVNIKEVKSGNEDLSDTDALITNTKGICIAVMSADCVPVLLYDPVNNACAAIHSGWKGTVGKIVTLTIEQMKINYGTVPSNLHACIGPSICSDVYEAGREVIEKFDECFGAANSVVFNRQANGKGYLDLWEANKIQLLNSNLLEKNIEVCQICTYKNSEQFYSARKSNNNTGRFAAGIMIVS